MNYLGTVPAFTIPSVPSFPLAIADGGTGSTSTALATKLLGTLLNEVVSTSALFTINSSHLGKLIDCTSGTFTVSLPPAANVFNGFTVAVRNSGVGGITVDPDGAELIDGLSTVVLSSTESCLIVCNGTSWKTIGRSGGSSPPGTVSYYAAAATPPSGWLFADGAAVSRAAYAALFSTISTVFGVGDGLTTFNLPDLRGYFIRGTGTNVDGTASAAFGTKQADALKSHTHTVPIAATEGSGGMSMVNSVGMDTTASGATGGAETRPKNIALQTIIKF